MTREEAIEWMGRIKDRYIHGGDEGFDNKRKEAIDMAIEALQAEPVCEYFYKGYCSRFEDGCFCQCRKGDTGDKRRSDLRSKDG